MTSTKGTITITQDKTAIKKSVSTPLIIVESYSDAEKISKQTRSKFLLGKVLEYFLDPVHGKSRLNIMYDFLKKKGTSPNALSLRVLEYAVIHYGEIKPSAAVINVPESGLISVFDHYKQQLTSFTKRQFDPCCRGQKERFGLSLTVDSEEGSEQVTIVTNLRQANFFKWAIEYGVVDYVKANLDDIRQRMAEKAKSVTTNGKTKKRKRDGAMKDVFTYTWAPTFERIGEPEPKKPRL